MTKITLPQTEADFDALVKKLAKKYHLPNEEHAAAVLANRIQQMPPDQATTTIEYLGACIQKNISYQIARSKSQKIQHKEQIDNIVSFLNENPNDMQAFDALQKAANEGSAYAKEQLAGLETIPENVVGLLKLDQSSVTDKTAESSEPA